MLQLCAFIVSCIGSYGASILGVKTDNCGGSCSFLMYVSLRVRVIPPPYLTLSSPNPNSQPQGLANLEIPINLHIFCLEITHLEGNVAMARRTLVLLAPLAWALKPERSVVADPGSGA